MSVTVFLNYTPDRSDAIIGITADSLFRKNYLTPSIYTTFSPSLRPGVGWVSQITNRKNLLTTLKQYDINFEIVENKHRENFSKRTKKQKNFCIEHYFQDQELWRHLISLTPEINWLLVCHQTLQIYIGLFKKQKCGFISQDIHQPVLQYRHCLKSHYPYYSCFPKHHINLSFYVISNDIEDDTKNAKKDVIVTTTTSEQISTDMDLSQLRQQEGKKSKIPAKTDEQEILDVNNNLTLSTNSVNPILQLQLQNGDFAERPIADDLYQLQAFFFTQESEQVLNQVEVKQKTTKIQSNVQILNHMNNNIRHIDPLQFLCDTPMACYMHNNKYMYDIKFDPTEKIYTIINDDREYDSSDDDSDAHYFYSYDEESESDDDVEVEIDNNSQENINILIPYQQSLFIARFVCYLVNIFAHSRHKILLLLSNNPFAQRKFLICTPTQKQQLVKIQPYDNRDIEYMQNTVQCLQIIDRPNHDRETFITFTDVFGQVYYWKLYKKKL